MLTSGRWLVFVVGFISSSAVLAAQPSKKAKNDLNRDAAIAAEQERAFGLSVSPKLLPNSSWFNENDNGTNPSLTDPMQGRWAKDPYAIPSRKRKN